MPIATFSDGDFSPGDRVVPFDSFASIWRSADENEVEPLPLAKMGEGDVALVISLTKRMALVLFDGVYGYVFLYRISKHCLP